MIAALRKLVRATIAAIDLRDVFVFGGIAAASYGAAQMYAPGGWLLAGAAIFWLGVRR